MARGPHFVVYLDSGDEWRWTFNARNGRTVCDGSEGYRTKAACKRAAERVQALMETATIIIEDD